MYAMNKLRLQDSRNHPFEKGFYARVKRAIESAREREAKAPIKKYKEDHINPKWDNSEQAFGMWNSRLEIWCMGEEKEIHPTFKTQREALEWYYDQL